MSRLTRSVAVVRVRWPAQVQTWRYRTLAAAVRRYEEWAEVKVGSGGPARGLTTHTKPSGLVVEIEVA